MKHACRCFQELRVDAEEHGKEKGVYANSGKRQVLVRVKRLIKKHSWELLSLVAPSTHCRIASA